MVSTSDKNQVKAAGKDSVNVKPVWPVCACVMVMLQETENTKFTKPLGEQLKTLKNTECTLKSATEKEEFEQIERTIKTNEESTKCLLQQKKFKKFNIMKHKPQASHKEANVKENEKGRPIRTYANALAQGPGRRSPSQENKQKTGWDQSPNVTSRNASANNLSNEEPTPIEKKSNFEPQQGKTNKH